MASVVLRANTGTAPVGTGTVVAILGVDQAADYDAAEWLHDPDLSAVAGLPIELWKLAGGTVRPMTAAEQATIALDELTALKAKRREEIDAKTREVIARGFVHGGKTFSLSREAQSYFIGMFAGRQILTATGSFPITINTLDDAATHDVADEAEVVTLYATAVGAVKAALGSGTVLKTAVRSATTQAELDAVVDTR